MLFGPDVDVSDYATRLTLVQSGTIEMGPFLPKGLEAKISRECMWINVCGCLVLATTHYRV